MAEDEIIKETYAAFVGRINARAATTSAPFPFTKDEVRELVTMALDGKLPQKTKLTDEELSWLKEDAAAALAPKKVEEPAPSKEEPSKEALVLSSGVTLTAADVRDLAARVKEHLDSGELDASADAAVARERSLSE